MVPQLDRSGLDSPADPDKLAGMSITKQQITWGAGWIIIFLLFPSLVLFGLALWGAGAFGLWMGTRARERRRARPS